MSSIFYAASPSGAGKTHNIVARACELAREHSRVLILQPTRELIKRTIENEVKPLSKPPECREFTQATIPSGKSVVREIIDYLNKAEDVG
jgi:superfamily II DNA or RNA helicase